MTSIHCVCIAFYEKAINSYAHVLFKVKILYYIRILFSFRSSELLIFTDGYQTVDLTSKYLFGLLKTNDHLPTKLYDFKKNLITNKYKIIKP